MIMGNETKELYKAQTRARRLEAILSELFDALDTFILIARFLIYTGSVLAAIFYLHDKVLAVAIVVSLTMAHLLIEARYFVLRKKKELKEMEL